jgi:hypothetical protein
MNALSLPYFLSERVAAGSHVGFRENQIIGRNGSVSNGSVKSELR